ncbi:MAG: hypothetical protein DCC46_10505 [Armatimonadetes bacterium]|nr:MAG: hypothetical protein DCC46_10505 [Armatimonadota bacterium]
MGFLLTLWIIVTVGCKDRATGQVATLQAGFELCASEQASTAQVEQTERMFRNAGVDGEKFLRSKLRSRNPDDRWTALWLIEHNGSFLSRTELEELVQAEPEAFVRARLRAMIKKLAESQREFEVSSR